MHFAVEYSVIWMKKGTTENDVILQIIPYAENVMEMHLLRPL